MKKENLDKIKVKQPITVYYKDEEDKTIEEIVLKLIEKEMGDRK